MKVTALLTGRGGSTLKDKNVRKICGQPLLHFPARAARLTSRIDEFYVSSDDEAILQAAHERGYNKIQRPLELSRPDAQHLDVVHHALTQIAERPEILIVLLANAPTIKPQWLDQSLDMLEADPTISAVVPVYKEQDHHPFRATRQGDDGALTTYFDFKDSTPSTNRQDLPTNYFLCHNFWTLNLEKSLFGAPGPLPWAFMGQRVMPLEVPICLDVHEEHDLEKCEKWLQKEWPEPLPK